MIRNIKELPHNDRCTLSSCFLRKFKDRANLVMLWNEVMSCHPNSIYLNLQADLSCLCMTPRAGTFVPFVATPTSLPPLPFPETFPALIQDSFPRYRTWLKTYIPADNTSCYSCSPWITSSLVVDHEFLPMYLGLHSNWVLGCLLIILCKGLILRTGGQRWVGIECCTFQHSLCVKDSYNLYSNWGGRYCAIVEIDDLRAYC